MEADVGKAYSPPGGESEKARTIPAEPSETGAHHAGKGPRPPHYEGFGRATQLIGEYKEYASYFLADQQAKAKAAMDTAFADMKHALSSAFKDNAHPTEWMGAYPWVSLGLGAAAGFLAGSALTPARDETFKERLNSLMEEVSRK